MSEYIVQVSSGVGPAEARRFALKLAEALEDRCAESGLDVKDVSCQSDRASPDLADADTRAPRSDALRVEGDVLHALGEEQGTHMLIHRSSARGRASRKRWFVAVTIHAVSCRSHCARSHVPRDELVITACRAGGPGGQHVNKVSTAVRVQHVPSGISVRVSSHRSQKSNIDRAIARIAALLAERGATVRAALDSERRLSHHQVVRGSPVRTYTMSPDGALLVTATGEAR
ncbi:MAG: peptide chain release factor H [Polyangiales bacterium]